MTSARTPRSAPTSRWSSAPSPRPVPPTTRWTSVPCPSARSSTTTTCLGWSPAT
ncbi:hypothetical protein T492DRAFT_1068006 [Pavlovales sp. CCMP2436]|nr:hypothetical protein T492DRAFT_1068006 [Pavlovales sp. CCMP2436]